MGVITSMEDLAAQRGISSHISFKMKQEYSKLCGFVRARMSPEIVISNSLLLHGHRDNEV